jgi:hypothetical protein
MQSIIHVSEYKVGAHFQNMKRVPQKYRPFSTTLHYLHKAYHKKEPLKQYGYTEANAYPDKIKQMKK